MTLKQIGYGEAAGDKQKAKAKDNTKNGSHNNTTMLDAPLTDGKDKSINKETTLLSSYPLSPSFHRITT